MWRKIAPDLAQEFTLVIPDLRGYGDSSKPPAGADFAAYSKRALAQDQVETMKALGFDRFSVAGHDRGARVTHRLLRDHPERIERAALLDIVPTLYRFETIDQKAATGSFHWFFLIQPHPFPERLIAAECELFLHKMLGLSGTAGGARTRGLCRVSALFPHSRDDPRDLRRISRRRVDRPRARPRRPRKEGPDAAADPMGKAQRPGQRLRHAFGMARARRATSAATRSRAAISFRRKSRTKPAGHCAISSPPGTPRCPGPDRKAPRR